MSESIVIARVIMVIGFLSVFGALLYAASGPPPFSNLDAFPQFNNPFSQNTIVSITSPDGNDLFNNTAYASLTGCAPASYWICVNNNDGFGSYVTLNTTSDLAGSSFFIHMRNVTTGGDVIRMVLTVWCRSVGQQTRTDNFRLDGGVTFTVPACPLSDTFQPVTAALAGFPEVWPLTSLQNASTGFLIRNFRSNGGLNGAGDSNAGNGTVQITYMELAVTQQLSTNPCGTIDVPCAIGRFFTPVVQAITFLVNVIIFAGSWLIYIVTFFYDLLLILVWFFTIPGTPATVQAIIDVTIMGLIGILVFLMVRIVRGVGQ